MNEKAANGRSATCRGLRLGRRVWGALSWPALLLLWLGLGNPAGEAQFGPLVNRRQAPQAQSQPEFDSYLEIYTSDDPESTVDRVKVFASEYEASEFLGLAYQFQMRAFLQLGDFDGLLQAGQKALELLPDNLNTLLTLATTIPNGVTGRADAEQLLSRAQDYAESALRQLETLKIPREIPLDSWEAKRAEMTADAHEALGHVAVKRGNLKVALREFQMAVTGNPNPKPSQLYRLGGAYVMAGQPQQAAEYLRRAAESGDDAVRRLALRELGRIETKQPD